MTVFCSGQRRGEFAVPSGSESRKSLPRGEGPSFLVSKMIAGEASVFSHAKGKERSRKMRKRRGRPWRNSRGCVAFERGTSSLATPGWVARDRAAGRRAVYAILTFPTMPPFRHPSAIPCRPHVFGSDSSDTIANAAASSARKNTPFSRPRGGAPRGRGVVCASAARLAGCAAILLQADPNKARRRSRRDRADKAPR
jgi:hypothetical protein